MRWSPRSTHARTGRSGLRMVGEEERTDPLAALVAREFVPEAGGYFNAGSKGPIAARGRRYVEEALVWETRPWAAREALDVKLLGELRTLFGRLIGAPAAEIAVATSTSEIVGKCAAGLRIPKGGRVACMRGEFPSNVNAWLARGEADGTPVDLLESPTPAPEADWLAKALRPGTAALTLSWVCFSTGARLDARAVGELCRERGVFLILDATQGIGAVPFDAAEIPFDVLSCSGYKWLLGPYGVAFGCFRPSAHDRLETIAPSWRSTVTGGDHAHLTKYTAEMLPGGARFDRGQAGSPLIASAAKGGLETLLEAGTEAIRDRCEALIARFARGLDARRWEIATPLDPERRGSILCIRPRNESPEDAARRFAEAGFAVSLREGAIRLSFHLFNTEAGVDALLSAAAKA